MDPATARERARTLALRERERFDEVRAYCMFVGIGRSGHSLVGTLLDAHRQAVIGHEVNALRHFEAGLSRDEVYSLIIDNSRQFTLDGFAPGGDDYDRVVPNSWHGRFESLLLIGDKRGGATTRRLRKSPELLDRVRQIVGVPIRVVHVLRNPYDNIASWKPNDADRTLERLMAEYFRACRTVARLEPILGDDLFHLRHEDLLAAPADRLTELCEFMGLDAGADYLADCASVVNPEPHRSRFNVGWPPEVRAEVQRRIGKFAFLSGYSFDS
jgi:hypothetical protein